MGHTEVDLEATMAEPSHSDRDRVWPPEKFNRRKHSQFFRLVSVFAYNEISGHWGIYKLGHLHQVPTWVRPEKDLTRKQRRTPVETFYFKKQKDVKLYIFSRIEPGLVLCQKVR